MKFQLLIASIVQSFVRWTSLSLLIGAISLTGCVSMMAKKNTYDAAASSPAVSVNGARVRLQLKPEGTSGGSFVLSAMVVSAASVTLDGPFRWRIEATGEDGRQESLIIHGLRTKTEKTKRDERYPVSELGRRTEFLRSKGDKGAYRAVYEIPGMLEVKPREDGALEVFVDLTVVGNGRSVRKLVHFKLDPSQKRQDEFIFVPTEIVKSIGKSSADWEDSGWD